MRILAIFNAKGGVGKTTTTVNLAACFAALGQRVVVLDLDSQGNATASLGLAHQPQIGSYDVVTGKAPVDQAMVATFIDNVSLIGATQDLAAVDLDMSLAGPPKRGVIRSAVAPVAAETDLLIMDCSPTFGSMTINALVSADYVLIPSQPSPYAHDGLIRTWMVVKRIQTELQTGLRVLGILPTFVGHGPSAEQGAADILSAMRAEFGDLVDVDGIPMETGLFAAATSVGLPACIISPKAPSSRIYLALADHLLGGGGTGAMIGLDEEPLGDTRRAEKALEVLYTWNHRADADGLFRERPNVPDVDEDAVREMAPAPKPDAEELTSGDWDRVTVLLAAAGAALMAAATGFLAGWGLGPSGL